MSQLTAHSSHALLLGWPHGRPALTGLTLEICFSRGSSQQQHVTALHRICPRARTGGAACVPRTPRPAPRPPACRFLLPFWAPLRTAVHTRYTAVHTTLLLVHTQCYNGCWYTEKKRATVVLWGNAVRGSGVCVVGHACMHAKTRGHQLDPNSNVNVGGQEISSSSAGRCRGERERGWEDGGRVWHTQSPITQADEQPYAQRHSRRTVHACMCVYRAPPCQQRCRVAFHAMPPLCSAAWVYPRSTKRPSDH